MNCTDASCIVVSLMHFCVSIQRFINVKWFFGNILMISRKLFTVKWVSSLFSDKMFRIKTMIYVIFFSEIIPNKY